MKEQRQKMDTDRSENAPQLAALIEAARYTLDNLEAADSEKLITAPRWFLAQLGESRKLLRAALLVDP
jgi:hypothetical protein